MRASCVTSVSGTYVMCDERQSGVVQVKPARDLAVGDEEDVTDPGSVLLQRPDRIAQLLNNQSMTSLLYLYVYMYFTCVQMKSVIRHDGKNEPQGR